jgi:effector-binding domain-containing protein
MPYEITVKELAPQPMVSIRTTCHAAVIGSTLAEILPEVFRYIRENDVYPCGPPFTRYHGFSDTEVDIEGGMPVKTPLPGKARIRAGELPGGRVATTIHIGPYERLPEAHDALHAWMREQEVEPAGPQWECYISDPGKEPDPNKRQTELVWPIR